MIGDEKWLKEAFIPTVQQRGAAIIKARGSSSAASAANAVVDTVRSLTTETEKDNWHSVAVCSDGSYAVEKGLISSFPVRTISKQMGNRAGCSTERFQPWENRCFGQRAEGRKIARERFVGLTGRRLMPKVCFLIPASPTRGFFSQIAAFCAALTKLHWSRWEPSVLVCLGDEPQPGALEEWRTPLREAALIFAPRSQWTAIPHYYAQIDGLFRWAPVDADALVRMDADTLPVGDLEDVLDHVAETSSIAGVMAHFTFPVSPGMNSREAWLHAADGLIAAPLDFRYSYSLTNASERGENRIAPFYLNDGVVFFAKAIFREYSERYLNLRPKLMERLRYPYFSGQVALALAVAEMKAHTCALPMRYNFPNDERATKKFPEELEGVKIFHYLRTEDFDRQRIFADAENYEEFLQMPLGGANKVFQDTVRQLLGAEFPFA